MSSSDIQECLRLHERSEKAIGNTKPPLYKVAPMTKILVEPCKALKSPFLVKRQPFCKPNTKILEELYEGTIADKLHIWKGTEDIQKLMKDEQKMDAVCLNLAVSNMQREDAHDFRNTKCLGWRHCVDSDWAKSSLGGCSNLKFLQMLFYRGSVLYNASQSHMVFIPVVIPSDHWTLYAFNMCDQKLSILDSLQDTTEGGDDPAERHQKTRCVVCDALTVTMNLAIDFRSWEYEFPKLPRQQNSYDSGFFVFNFMRLWDGHQLVRWFPLESKELRKDFLAYILSCKDNNVHLPKEVSSKIKDLPGKMMDCKLQEVAAAGDTLNSMENELAITICQELEPSSGSSNEYICYFNSHWNPSREAPAESSAPDPSSSSSNFLSRCYRVTPDGDGVLHIAVRFANLKLVDDIRENHEDLARVLLSAANNRGDTTLHYAAFRGYDAMVKLLLSMMSNTGIAKFLRAQNLKGGTCLHEAVRYSPFAIVEMLISKDLSIQDLSRPTLVQIVDNEGVSPLYLATTLGRVDIVRALTQRPYKQDDKYVASCVGPSGKTALHAAVVLLDKELVKILLEWNAGLTSQGDESGSTPLHFLASLPWKQHTERNMIIEFLYASLIPLRNFRWFRNIMKKEWHIVELIMEKDPLSLLYTDSTGSLPLHIAAAHGRLGILRKVLIQCHRTVFSLNASGQNFIHVAVEKEKLAIVSYICQHRRKYGPQILNVQDQDGNTALHLAVNNASENIFYTLMANSDVFLNHVNKEGYTPLDLAFLSRHLEVSSKGPRKWIYFLLLHGGGDFGTFSWDHLTRNAIKPDWEKDSERVGKSASMLTVSAALILNAALLAPFNVLSHKDKLHLNGGGFKTFVALDTATFVSSAAATFFCARAGFAMSDGSTRLENLVTGTFFLGIAVLSMTCTVALALLLVLPAKTAIWPISAAGWGILLYMLTIFMESNIFGYLAAMRARVGILSLISILLFQRSTIKPPWVVPSASTRLFWTVAYFGIWFAIIKVAGEKHVRQK